jgi:hypothetical protein
MILKHDNANIVCEHLASYAYGGGWLRLVPCNGPPIEVPVKEAHGLEIVARLQKLHGPVVELMGEKKSNI